MSSLHKFSWMILNGRRCSEIGLGEGKAGSCDSSSGFARAARGGEARQEARYPNNFRHSSLKKLSKTGM